MSCLLVANLIMSLSFALMMSCFNKPCALILNGLFASKWVEPFFNGPRDILQYHNLPCFLVVQTYLLSMYCSNFFVCARAFSVHSHETNSHRKNQQITRLNKYNMFVIFKTSNKDFVSTEHAYTSKTKHNIIILKICKILATITN